MTCATTVNLCATRGLDWLASIEDIRDAAGALVDFTGKSLLMRIGKRGASAHVLELSTENDRLASPEAGAITISVPRATMAEFPAGEILEEYVHSLLVVDGDVQVPVWQGLFTLHTDPTQSWST